MATAQATPLSGRTAWARNLAAPVRDFLSTETGGAIVLLGWRRSSRCCGRTRRGRTPTSRSGRPSCRSGSATRASPLDLRHWVNDGLMTFFFFVVGLEARREFDMGELRERRRLALPVVAALGGMVVPVADLPGVQRRRRRRARLGRGDVDRHRVRARRCSRWSAPRGPTRLRVFLLTLAVVDDLVRAARDRDRLHRARLAHRARGRGRAVRRARRPALRAGRGAGRGLRRGRRRRSGSPCSSRASTRRSPAWRWASSRAPTRRRAATSSGPPRAVALVPRAADAGARALGAARRSTSAVSPNERLQPAAPVDELRDRPAVRAGQRRHHDRRRPAAATR